MRFVLLLAEAFSQDLHRCENDLSDVVFGEIQMFCDFRIPQTLDELERDHLTLLLIEQRKQPLNVEIRLRGFVTRLIRQSFRGILAVPQDLPLLVLDAAVEDGEIECVKCHTWGSIAIGLGFI